MKIKEHPTISCLRVHTHERILYRNTLCYICIYLFLAVFLGKCLFDFLMLSLHSLPMVTNLYLDSGLCAG